MDKSKRIDERDLQLRLCRAELQELRDSLRFVELQFAKAQEVGGALTQQLAEAHNRYGSAQVEVSTLREELQARSLEAEDWKGKFQASENSSQSAQRKLTSELESLRSELQGKDRELDALARSNAELRSDVQRLQTQLQVAATHAHRLEGELAVRGKELSYLQVKLLSASELREGEVELLNMSSDSIDPKVAEIHQLQTEKEHLLELIRSSPQLHDLGDLEADSGGLRFCPEPRKCSRRHCPGSGAACEFQDWVPSGVYRLFDAFQLRYSLDRAALAELMHAVNAVWRFREANRLQRLKRRAHTVIKDLQRQLVLGTASPEDAWEVQQLKTQLREMIEAKRREEAECVVCRAIEVTSVAFSQDGENAESLRQAVRLEASKMLGTIHSAIEEQFESPESDTSTTIRHSQEWLMVRPTQQQVSNAVENFLEEVERVA